MYVWHSEKGWNQQRKRVMLQAFTLPFVIVTVCTYHCIKKIIPIMEFCIEMSYFHQVLYVGVAFTRKLRGFLWLEIMYTA